MAGASAESGSEHAPRRKRHLIVVGGGRGGVGKTLLAVNLGVYFAQLGRNVVLGDADPNGSNLHTVLGHDRPPLALPEELEEGRAPPVETTVPGLKILPTAYDPWTMAPKRPMRRSHWVGNLARLDADYVVLNVGASTGPAALDLFSEADAALCVAAPEPTAIESTYRFCRALFARRLKRVLAREPFKMRVLERALEGLPALPTPLDLVARIARFDGAVANLAATTLQELRPRLVVGKTRLKRDLDLGPAMVSLAERYLGVRMDYLGTIEQDDAVWLTARRRLPLLIDAPTAKSARNIERVARRALAALAQSPKTRRPPLAYAEINAPPTLYAVLGVARTATDDEIRRAHKLQRETFRAGSLPIVSLVDETRMRAEQGRIAEAYDTLLDPTRRRAYDLSIFADAAPPASERGGARSAATEAELAVLRAELAREITPETEYSGALLRLAREAQGVELGEIARVTKISESYLHALENEELSALPAGVYVRGFLQQVAKALGLDPSQVSRSYLRRLRALRRDD
jgi:flagellar biosynthesis protein FlhG